MRNKIIRILSDQPIFILLAAFLFLIFCGSLLLWLPWASFEDQLSLNDAFFTTVSAVTATGLVVKEGVDFSLLGQIIILILIQVGVLVVVSFAALILSYLGGMMAVSPQAAEEITDKKQVFELPRLFRFILLYTLVFEAIGFVIFFIHWYPVMPFGKAIFYSLFHSVSGFSNAGFTLFRGNLLDFQKDLVINITIPTLIIFGSLGFTVLWNLKDWFSSSLKKKERKQLELHTKIVLVTTAIVTITGSLLFYLFEVSNLSHLSFQETILASSFHVMGRTAGFNTLDIANLNPATLFLMMILMFIGGAPNSGAGGIKVTTLFLASLMIFTLFRGKEEIIIWGSSISRNTIWKAFSIILVFLSLIVFFILILLYTEKAPFEQIVFEAFSAFGIAGFSMGLTPLLSEMGKLLIALLMLIGRIGPLVLVVALTGSISRAKIHYPEERVIVG